MKREQYSIAYFSECLEHHSPQIRELHHIIQLTLVELENANGPVVKSGQLYDLRQHFAEHLAVGSYVAVRLFVALYLSMEAKTVRIG